MTAPEQTRPEQAHRSTHRTAGPLAYRELPVGTTITFISRRGALFVVRIVGRVMDAQRYGGARQVKVLEATRAFDDSAAPTHMLAVPPGTDVRIMADAYRAAIPTISLGDAVFLIDVYDMVRTPVWFRVAEMSIDEA